MEVHMSYQKFSGVRSLFIHRLSLVLLVAGIVSPTLMSAQTNFKTLYTFSGGTDGYTPLAGVVRDGAGNLYGTTAVGGASKAGTVFKLSPKGVKKILHNFSGYVNGDGNGPEAPLVLDSAGNLYGTTVNGSNHDGLGTGVVFKVDKNGNNYSILHYFGGTGDGRTPLAALLVDGDGNLYGTTEAGGLGLGTVFQITPEGGEIILYNFTGGADGRNPLAGLIRDAAGNLYGTTNLGGSLGLGVAFKLSPEGDETVLHNFDAQSSDEEPRAPLLLVGNTFFGTTSGVHGANANGGTVFKLNAAGSERVVHSFPRIGGTDGREPLTGLIRDTAGNLYGVTSAGGGTSGCGTVFKLDPSGNETVLYRFTCGADGKLPYGLVRDAVGNLYGVTREGGNKTAPGCFAAGGCGTVFELTFSVE
jgi:uncharacterized repeat protein (TIGR03803 family)